MKMFKKKIKEEESSSRIMLPIEYKKGSSKILYCSINVFFVLLSMCFLVPLLWMLLSAFKDTQEFLKIPVSFFPENISFEKFAHVWKQTNLGSAYIWTFIMVLGNLAFSLVINGLAGYVLSRLKPKGSSLILAIVLWTMMMPDNLSLVPRFKMFIDVPVFHISLMDTYWPMWFLHAANPFYTILFKGFFDNIPKSYIESARIDGCSDLSIFAKIIVPLSKPIIMTVAIYCFNGSWGNFFWPYLIIKDIDMLPLGVKMFTMKSELPIDQYMVMLIFVIIPPVLCYVFLQKYISKGMSMGGVKG